VTRIGLVVHGQPPELVGGTERLVSELAESLSARGDAVEIFSGSIEWRPAFEVVRDESGAVPIVRVHRHDLFFERWDKLENPFVERAFGAWLDEFKPDLVHVHHWARLTTRLVSVAKTRGVPVVLSLHDLFSTCPRYHRVKADLSFCDVPAAADACRNCAPRWRFQGDAEIDGSVGVFAADLRAEVAAADALVAPTEGHGRRVLQWLELDRPVTAIAPASAPAIEPATRPLGSESASIERPLAVGVFGHLHPLKGVEVLLDAQAALRDPSLVELHVWGAAPTPEMDAAVKARAGDRRVVWHGAYQPGDLSGAPVDVAVLPTLCAESYSFAADEAAALGVPILASDLGALTDRATGRHALFPRGDAAALAALLAELAADPARRDAMATAPAPPLTHTGRHLAELSAVYDALPAAALQPAPASADADLARREHAFTLREAGLHELLRSEGWEDEISRLQAEIARLQGP
jgi:glycosyltransferase involved in cell wall biosynthesis